MPEIDAPQDKINRVVEFPSGHTLETIRNDSFRWVHYQGESRPRACLHNALAIDEHRGLVRCKHCDDEMSPLEALKVLSKRIWWEENQRERDMEHQIKRVSTVQREAFECLWRAGITPEKYAERWQKQAATEIAKGFPNA